MASRPGFYVSEQNKINSKDFVFQWYPGLSSAQKKRSISALHTEIANDGFLPLEISTKSSNDIGIKLSAFSLKLSHRYLESVYHSAKVFETHGPHPDIQELQPRQAKRDERLKTDRLVGYMYDGEFWPVELRSAFYDYIYLKAVKESLSKEDLEKLAEYTAFTDIEYNPKKGFCTQARTVAILKLVLQLYNNQIPDWTMAEFIDFHTKYVIN